MEKVLLQLDLHPTRIVEADKDLTKDAAVLTGRYGIAYADCFASALARKKSAVLVTRDPQFGMIEKKQKCTLSSWLYGQYES